MTRYLFIVLLLMPLALAGESDRILIPIFLYEPVEGANGSLWATELAVLNQGDTRIDLEGYDFNCGFGCVDTAARPGITFYPRLNMGAGFSKPHGYFFLLTPVPGDPPPNLAIKLRSRDLSRQMDDWGTEIPTIAESEAPVGHFNLLDVPTDPRYRLMIRLYHFGTEAVQARIRYYATPTSVRSPYFGDVNPDVLLAEETVVMTVPPDAAVPEYEELPGYAELTGIVERHPVLASHPRIRVEVESSVEDLKIWGFLTITNNQTQHVTVVSP